MVRIFPINFYSYLPDWEHFGQWQNLEALNSLDYSTANTLKTTLNKYKKRYYNLTRLIFFNYFEVTINQ